MSNQRAPVLIEATDFTEPHLFVVHSRPMNILRLDKRNFVNYWLTPVQFIDDLSLPSAALERAMASTRCDDTFVISKTAQTGQCWLRQKLSIMDTGSDTGSTV